MKNSTHKHILLFFFDDFHHGAMNHLIHSIGFTMLGYGLGKQSIFLVIFSPFIMELGHVYNYFRGVHREYAIKIIPLQWLAWIVFVGLGYLITKIV